MRPLRPALLRIKRTRWERPREMGGRGRRTGGATGAVAMSCSSSALSVGMTPRVTRFPEPRPKDCARAMRARVPHVRTRHLIYSTRGVWVWVRHTHACGRRGRIGGGAAAGRARRLAFLAALHSLRGRESDRSLAATRPSARGGTQRRSKFCKPTRTPRRERRSKTARLKGLS